MDSWQEVVCFVAAFGFMAYILHCYVRIRTRENEDIARLVVKRLKKEYTPEQLGRLLKQFYDDGASDKSA